MSSEAPERIWISKSVPEFTTCDPNDPDFPLTDYGVEYVRADLVKDVLELSEAWSRSKQRIEELERERKDARQAFMELQHCHEQGPGWFTRGKDGMYQHFRMWLNRGFAATEEEKGDGRR